MQFRAADNISSVIDLFGVIFPTHIWSDKNENDKFLMEPIGGRPSQNWRKWKKPIQLVGT